MNIVTLYKLASSFQKLAVKNAMYAYHVTLKEFLPSILKEGLSPQLHEHDDEPVIFVERDREEAEIYAQENTVVIRFLVDGFGCTEDGEDVLYDPISPKEIEVSEHNSNTWTSLEEYVNGIL